MTVQVLFPSGHLCAVCTRPAEAWAVLDADGAPAKAVLPDGALVDIIPDAVEVVPPCGDNRPGTLQLRLADGQTVRRVQR